MLRLPSAGRPGILPRRDQEAACQHEEAVRRERVVPPVIRSPHGNGWAAAQRLSEPASGLPVSSLATRWPPAMIRGAVCLTPSRACSLPKRVRSLLLCADGTPVPACRLLPLPPSAPVG